MDKDELVHEIGAMLLEDEDIQASGPWRHLAMVVQFMSGSTQVNSTDILRNRCLSWFTVPP